MKYFEEQYLGACSEILDYGYTVTNDRTGVGTKMVTNVMLEHQDVERMFPLLMTKKLATKAIFGELLWFLEGSDDDARLAAITYNDPKHRTIWTDNYEAPHWQEYLEKRWPGQKDSFMGYVSAYENDDIMNGRTISAPVRWLGPIYGKQWREGGGTDQLLNMIEGIKKDPHGRRHIVNSWNVQSIEHMALPPCHMSFQINVIGSKLDLLMTQRSGDMFLGVPFNMASYALLLKIIARETGYKAGKVSIVIGNAHIYLNHIEQMREQLSRRKSREYRNTLTEYQWADYPNGLPQVEINTNSQLFDKMSRQDIGYRVSDFKVTNYAPLPTIKGLMAV